MSNFSRRKFLANNAAILAGFSIMGMVPFDLTAKEPVIKLGLIGCGQRGTGIAHTVKNLPGMEILAFCDIDQKKLTRSKKYSESSSVKFYTDYQSLLGDKDIDGVIIAVPLYLHYQMAVDALSAGKHVYVEKTMTYNIAEALSLVKKVKDSGKILQVGHQYRYYALYHKIKEMIAANWLGTITHFECQYNRNSDWRKEVSAAETERQVNWRLYRKYSGGLLAELSAHQIDIVNWFLEGHPEKVTGLGDINYWEDGREINDNVRVIYEYANGVKSSITSVLSSQFHGYEIRILGSKATVVIKRDTALIYSEPLINELGIVDGVTGATVESVNSEKGTPVVFSSPNKESIDPTASALLDFAACIREKRQPFSNVYTGKDAAIAVHLGNQAIDRGSMQFWQPDYSML